MDDLISRQEAIMAIEEYADRLQMVNWKENPNVPYKVYSLNWCINTIRDLPTIDAVPVRKGRWLSDASGYGFWVCSCCKFPSEAFAANVLYKFCPNCGARMEQKE